MADSTIVDLHIRNPRIKLQDHDRHPRFIATVPGRGYRFTSDIGWDGGPSASEPART